jgi:hypothetical protein
MMYMKDFAHRAIASPVKSAAEPGRAPARRPLTCGMVAGTLVETATGWKPVEALSLGDALQTLDGGLAWLHALDRQILTPAQNPLLVHLPGGAFDACSDLLLLPGQLVLLDTLGLPVAGQPDALYVFVPAMALIGLQGVRRFELRHPREVITPFFAEEEMVYAQTGVLLHCPALMAKPGGGFFPQLDLFDAIAFLRLRDQLLAA